MALNDAVEEKNTEYVSYLTGRVSRIILIPEPLESDDFDEDLPDDWNLMSLPSTVTSKKQKSGAVLREEQKRLGDPPQYLDAKDMNYFFITLFIIEGFGQETIGFKSTFSATKCSEYGWSFYELILFEMIPAVKLLHLDDFLEHSTLFLRQIDPFFKHCIATGDDYEEAIFGYGKAISDPYYLSLNLLYHTQDIYESYTKIHTSITSGF